MRGTGGRNGLGRFAAWLDARWNPKPEPAPVEPAGPPEETVRFLRDCGVALCCAGETTSRVEAMLGRLGERYGVHPVHAFVLPTGVFVRVGDGPHAVVDFAPVDATDTMRLDQIAELYRFVHQLDREPVPPEEGTRRLAGIYAMPPRFTAASRVVGHFVLAVGLGLLTGPNLVALAGYAGLGVAVAVLRELVAGPLRRFTLALPVVAAILVTALAFRYSGPWLGQQAATMIIPPLVVFLPGAALTMGTMELASGSWVSGTARLVYGINVLVLLAFGITVAAQLVAVRPLRGTTPHPLGLWAPWLGVLALAVGFALNSSAPRRALPWLAGVLLVAHVAQLLGTTALGGLFGAFLGGAVLPLCAHLAQRWPSAPPDQVTFLPAFWMLVPGSVSLTGVGELLAGRSAQGLPTIVNALLTIVAVALGVLVAASLGGQDGYLRPGQQALRAVAVPEPAPSPPTRAGDPEPTNGPRVTGI